MAELTKIQQQSVDDLIGKELADGRGIEAIMQRFQNCVIVKALELTDGNQTQAAALLKTHRNNLVRWIHENNIPVKDSDD